MRVLSTEVRTWNDHFCSSMTGRGSIVRSCRASQFFPLYLWPLPFLRPEMRVHAGGVGVWACIAPRRMTSLVKKKKSCDTDTDGSVGCVCFSVRARICLLPPPSSTLHFFFYMLSCVSARPRPHRQRQPNPQPPVVVFSTPVPPFICFSLPVGAFWCRLTWTGWPANQIACSYKSLPTSVKAGSKILVADGSLVLTVKECKET